MDGNEFVYSSNEAVELTLIRKEYPDPNTKPEDRLEFESLYMQQFVDKSHSSVGEVVSGIRSANGISEVLVADEANLSLQRFTDPEVHAILGDAPVHEAGVIRDPVGYALTDIHKGAQRLLTYL